MKIYFIGQKGIPAKFGGIERHVEDLSVRLANKGHEVFVYTRPNYTSQSLKEYKAVKLISIPNIPTKHFDAITHTARACFDVARRDADIIHFHSIGPASLIWLVKLLKPRVPIVATFHTKCYLHKKWGIFARFYLKFGERMACKASNQTIAVSKSLKKYADNKYGIGAVYIPNGVDINKDDEFRTMKDNENEREKFATGEFFGNEGIEKWNFEKDGYILAVSRLVGHKGLHFLIAAYKKLKTDKKLVIVGDGVYTDKYVQQLKSLAFNNLNIVFTGNQTGKILHDLYKNAYLFVQPSESEGLSMALLEAMAYGNAVLISDIPENTEATGKLGITFRSKDSEDLLAKLEYLLKNPKLVRRLGLLGIERSKKRYNLDNIVKETIKVYEHIMGHTQFNQ
ncbi:MAG: glycosyltransferase family 4 protein [bacterium]